MRRTNTPEEFQKNIPFFFFVGCECSCINDELSRTVHGTDRRTPVDTVSKENKINDAVSIEIPIDDVVKAQAGLCHHRHLSMKDT